MKKYVVVVAFLTFAVALNAQNKPKLVVGIVVDQMRYEMLDRFAPSFGNGGFNRLRNQGLSYDSCTYNYIPTYTGPGHATIFTGKNPDVHGIVANDWYMAETKKWMNCVQDDSVYGIGTADENFNCSPIHLRAETLGETMILKTGGYAQSYSISIKNRGAILPQGKIGNGAFWVDKEGNFATSSFFLDEPPFWVNEFNDRKLAEKALNDVWVPLYADSVYNVSYEDATKYERDYLDNGATFPYPMSALQEKYGNKILMNMPFGNTLLTEFALALLENTLIGRDEIADILTISYSSIDKLAHDLGPNSKEVHDMFLRLDLDLERLLNKLDETVGVGQYVVFLTSDHGAANTAFDPEFSYASSKAFTAFLNQKSQEAFGVDLVAKTANYQVYIDAEALKTAKLKKDKALVWLVNLMKNQTEMALTDVFTAKEIANCKTGNCQSFANAYVPELAGDIYFRTRPGVVFHPGYGTHHGSDYLYDTHVPLLIFNGGKQGRDVRPIHLNQVKDLVLKLVYD